MPIINFAGKDLLRGKIVQPAWYRVRIDAIGEKPAKNGESTNYPVEATILRNADDGDTTYQNVPLDWMFNSKALGFAVPFLAALGQDIKAGARYDLNAASGKEVDVFVENELYEGNMKNRVNHKYRAVRE